MVLMPLEGRDHCKRADPKPLALTHDMPPPPDRGGGGGGGGGPPV